MDGIFSNILIIMDLNTTVGMIARKIRFIRPGTIVAWLAESAFRPSFAA
jgi:hypothetical protein